MIQKTSVIQTDQQFGLNIGINNSNAEGISTPQGTFQNIDPYANPGHILSPPRHWLESVKAGQWSNAFFRLRYKSLLRRRVQAEPERFRILLEAAERKDGLTLGCACGQDSCHTHAASDFLRNLSQKGLLPKVHKVAQASQSSWRGGLQARMVLATLTDSPNQDNLKSA